MSIETTFLLGWVASTVGFGCVCFLAGALIGGYYLEVRKEPPRDFIP